MTDTNPAQRGFGLAFLLGGFRSGTTLARKVLDSHPEIHSPAETWFLLPLLNMWDGRGETPHFNTGQASAALKQHLNQEQFVRCAHAFANEFYASSIPSDARWFVDKTPLYLNIAPALPVLFPDARFIVLARDPRGVCWSRHTWRHSQSSFPESLIGGVAKDTQKLAAFVEANADRSLLIRYEELCAQPADIAENICEFLGLSSDQSMIDYGKSEHHEGYGDENTRSHQRPHELSIDRWRDGLTMQVQAALIDTCGKQALKTLGYNDIAPISTEKAA